MAPGVILRKREKGILLSRRFAACSFYV